MSFRNEAREHFARRHGRGALRIAGLVVGGIAVAVLFAFLFGLVVKVLWNWLMPALFGLGTITFWQAFGLVLLAKILFGGPGHHRRPDRIERRLRDRAKRIAGAGEGPLGPEDVPGNGRRWRHFRQYWQDEGRAAFDEYLRRKEAQETDPAGSA